MNEFVERSVIHRLPYTTTDSRNNTTEKQVKVIIVDTDVTVEGPLDFDGKKQYARFIDSSYYLKSYENGGLESTSKWKSEVTYKDTLEAAMYNVKGEDGDWSHSVKTWEFSKEDIDQVKQYVKDNRLGNSKNGTAISRFLNLFARCRNY